MSHNVCYSTKTDRPKSFAVFDDGKWLVHIGDLVYYYMWLPGSASKPGKFAWLVSEITGLNSSFGNCLMELYVPCIKSYITVDINLRSSVVRRCFDKCCVDGCIVGVGDLVCPRDYLFELAFEVLKIQSTRLLIRSIISTKFPSFWCDADELIFIRRK